jgi:hypothetical protein
VRASGFRGWPVLGIGGGAIRKPRETPGFDDLISKGLGELEVFAYHFTLCFAHYIMLRSLRYSVNEGQQGGKDGFCRFD